MDVLQTLFKKLKTVVCRPILHHGFPIQSKSIVKQLRQNITVTTLKLEMKKWSSQWTQFMQLRKEAWKKCRTSTGFEPVTSRAMLYQLSYEATDVGSRSIVGSYVPVKEMSVNDIWNKSYMNCGNEMEIEHICSIVGSYVPTIEHINPHMNPQLTCSQRQWLHSSVGRASHR